MFVELIVLLFLQKLVNCPLKTVENMVQTGKQEQRDCERNMMKTTFT